MRKIIAFVICTIMILSQTCCSINNRASVFNIDAVKYYTDIPNITQNEIDSIEAIKAKYNSLAYGHILGTEAFILPDGKYLGFTPMLCTLMSDLFGIEVTPKMYDKWNQFINDLDNHVMDLTGELTQTPDRAKQYFMTHSIAERSLSIFTIRSSDRIKTEFDIEGLKIGFLAGAITEEYIRKSYPVSFTAVNVENHIEVAEKLKSGEIDAFVTDSIMDITFEKYDFISSREFFPLVYMPISMTTANSELEPIISVFNKYLSAGGTNKLYELYKIGNKEYIRYKLDNSFTEEEKQYLDNLKASGQKVSLALEHDNYPVSFYNEKELEFQGIAVDVIKEIEDLSGIRFDVKTDATTSWADIFKSIQSGEISMVSQLLYSDQRKDLFLWSSKPYVSSHYALISKSDFPSLLIYQVVHSKVGNISKSGFQDEYNDLFPNNTNSINFDTQNDALDALEKGSIDLLMATEHILLTQLNYREKTGYRINITFNRPIDSMFGFNKNEIILCSIVDKTQAFIKTRNIAKDWETRVFDYSKKFANERAAYLLVAVILLLGTLAISLRLTFKNKRLAKDLKRQTATITNIYTYIPDVVFSLDTDFRYTSCNPSFERFASKTEAEIVGKRNIEVFGNTPLASIFDESNRKVLESKKVIVAEEFLTYPNGERRLMETIKTPIFENGALRGLMGISRDITEHKAAEESAKVASKAKSTFLASISHEIRTPLNAIVGMSNIAKRSIDNRVKAISSINQIIASSDHLLAIINDVLDMSKIESGKLELGRESFSLLDACNEVSEFILHRCIEKHIDFVANTNIHDIILIGDKLRIKQVLINLMGNAVKFTEQYGKIIFSVDVLKEDMDEAKIAFSVSDNGIGMSEEQISKLFTPFEQTNTSVAAKFGGTGLGLSISQNLINMMGGVIKVESQLNVGSRFYFEVLLEKGESETYDATETPELIDLEGKRILLVEDIEINRIIVQEMLAATNIKIDEAQDGKEAIEVFRRSTEGYYNLIFMDVQMPRMDGYEATKAIRMLNRSDAKRIPIVAMTANAYKEDENNAFKAGMNAHLSKPIYADALMKVLNDFLK